MKKVTFCSFIILSFLLLGCSDTGAAQNVPVEAVIHSIVEDETNSELSLSKVTEFSWEKAWLIEPYTTQESINDQLGTFYEDPSNIEQRDDIYLLVFMNDTKVVSYAEIERQQCSLNIGAQDYLTPAEDTVFIDRH
nr:hypothetical protein [Alkalicoccus daliensis]